MAESLWCASFTEAQGADPVGSAGEYHDVIVVDLGLPWPREILDHPSLVGASAAIDEAARRGRLVRVLGCVPAGDDGTACVRHWSRKADGATSGFDGVERVVEADDVGAAIVAAVADGPQGTPATGRHVLVCTHGARDRCCGSFGTRLHRYLAAGPTAPGATILRISHTGGHRFAPTAITFPEGRAWAFLTDAIADTLVAGAGPASVLRRHDRGSLAMPPAAQVVDAALLAREGWPWLSVARDGRIVEVTDDGTLAEVAWTDADGVRRVATARVHVRREIPGMTCGVAVDPHTTYPEFGLRDLTVH